jgi:excisionase family DNA binding protein
MQHARHPARNRKVLDHTRVSLRESASRCESWATVRRVSNETGAIDGGADGARFPPILTTSQAAELLQVHVEYLRRMVREGRVPAHRFPGGREIRFHRDELIEWVRGQPGHDRSPGAAERAGTEVEA